MEISNEKIEKIINSFKKYYKQYSNKDIIFLVNESKRFDNSGGDFYIYKIVDNKKKLLEVWYWEEIRFIGNESDFVFEKQNLYDSYKIDVNIDLKDNFNFILYTNKSEFDNNLIGQDIKNYCNDDFYRDVKNKIIDAILHDKIDIKFICNDSDCYECPPSRIRNKIISI